MRSRLMRPVITMALAELVLVMHQLPLLFGRQHTELPIGIRLLLDTCLGVRADFLLRALWKVVVVGEAWEVALFAEFPTEAVIVGDVDHVVGIDTAEGGEAVAHDGKETDEDAVYDVDNVGFAVAWEGEPAD